MSIWRPLILTLLLGFLSLELAHAQQRLEPHPSGDGMRLVPPLSALEQEAFLTKPAIARPRGTFGSFSSHLFALTKGHVVIHSDEKKVNDSLLQDQFLPESKPTWKEVFRSLSLQTDTQWKYDPDWGYWKFSAHK